MFTAEKEALERATERLKSLMGDNLVAVLAFGSRVRGDFTAESDFDVLVVVKKRTFDLIGLVTDVFHEEEEKAGVPFSVVVKTEDSFGKERKYKTAFYRNVKEEGLVLYGTP